MKGIQISDAGGYAELQPGLTNGDLIRYLWAHGKQTVTGNCLCTGIMGIMLGGGHGYLQGLFGLLADQILEARVVLADGSSVVASKSSNRNLFYALRGAGHNFGIVTGLKYKVYDRIDHWTEINFIFTHDKLEQVFELSNNNYLAEADHPAELIMWYTFMRRPDIDPSNAVINMLMIYAGPASGLEPFAAPFRMLSPARELVYTSVAYPDLFALNRNDEASIVTCGKGLYRHMMPNYLARHNVTALRSVHTLFNNITAQYPSVGFTSVYVVESYSQQAVTAVRARDTATPYREYPLLASPVWGYSNSSYSADIIATSKAMRKAMAEGSGQPLRAYLNYGFGDETLAELYGDEPWRVPRLRALKTRYDPKNRFRFYAPINPRP
ncbi:hypothetical protein OQA88_1799 [Cercophora sp. LCS_1]